MKLVVRIKCKSLRTWRNPDQKIRGKDEISLSRRPPKLNFASCTYFSKINLLAKKSTLFSFLLTSLFR